MSKYNNLMYIKMLSINSRILLFDKVFGDILKKADEVKSNLLPKDDDVNACSKVIGKFTKNVNEPYLKQVRINDFEVYECVKSTNPNINSSEHISKDKTEALRGFMYDVFGEEYINSLKKFTRDNHKERELELNCC